MVIDIPIVTAILVATHLECMALNIYHEARGESREGQIAVGHVTLNRVKSKKYPDTICEVVYQNKQFSWTHDRIPDRPRDIKNYNRIKRLSYEILQGLHKDPTSGSTYFHTKKVNPWWSRSVKRTRIIGNHIFYRR